MHFQKSYDEEFYEFPLDETVTASFENFYAFCNITKQKMACWEQQCRIHSDDIAWTSDLHICILRRSQAESALNCLNRTSVGAHTKCNRLCRTLARRHHIKMHEKQYLYGTSSNSVEVYQYWQLSKQCAFQICQLECRKELMRNVCASNETVGALDTLQDYYEYDMFDQLRSMTDSSTEHLFPLMCRQYLPLQYHLKVIHLFRFSIFN
ncbi:unnamed protein product [Thelazia callipaeda]|uniref:DB domain-containing protein n=1 Tax=Thelazia callipaeda TaxID=103827 RepID=A0A0N5CSX2_THECL|nr:unnamed protein product [Thelazia callipaeda]